MTRRHSFNQFLILICLTSILGIATNATLMMHLACCHKETACDHNDHGHKGHPTPTHDHEHCLFCQMFLGISGKYMAPPVDVGSLIDTNIFWSVTFTPQSFVQRALTCATPRGPPIA